jgi:Sulfotransferase family
MSSRKFRMIRDRATFGNGAGTLDPAPENVASEPILHRDDRRLNILYIDAAARSGSTILARVIGAQPGFMTIGEAVLVWRFGALGDDVCSCGQKFSRCEFWQQVRNAAPGLFDTKVVGPYVEFLNSAVLQSRRLAWLWSEAGRRRMVQAIPPGFLHDLFRLYEAVRTVSGADVIVDSSKFAGYRFLLSLIPDLKLSAIHLIRDPRAVAFSWQRSSTHSPASTDDESLRFNERSTFISALDWFLQNSSTDRLNRVEGRPVHRVRYEDFVARPQSAMYELGGTQLAPGGHDAAQSGCVDSVELPRVHIFGNPSRFRTGSVPLRLDDEWRRQMPRGQRVTVSVLAAPLLHRYGYPRSLV